MSNVLPVTTTFTIHALDVFIVFCNSEFSYWSKRETRIVSIGIIMNLKHKSLKPVISILCKNGNIFRPRKKIKIKPMAKQL